MNAYIGSIKNDYIFTNIVNTPRWFDLKDLPNEVWENIKGYNGVYKISNKGRVKSKYREYDAGLKYGNMRKVKERILKAVNNGKYYIVRLYTIRQHCQQFYYFFEKIKWKCWGKRFSLHSIEIKYEFCETKPN